ncbi:HAD hydrolase family protein, partial [candidate division WWE3 bacterium]|nr:HAD hydrolase family protein [candidate division WWE3 bacterium]
MRNDMTLLPKLIIFGLDSVLLPPRTSLSGDVHLYQPTVEKIALLKSQGVIVTVATGRGITRLSEVVDTLLPNTAVICEDVKLYNYQDKTLISTECFQPEEIDQIGSIIQSGVVEFCGFCPEGDSKYIFWFSDTAQEEKITQVLGSIIKKSTYDIDVFVDLAKKEKAAHIPMKVSQSPSMPDGLNWKYNPSLQMVDIDPSVCESGYGLRKICEFVG